MVTHARYVERNPTYNEEIDEKRISHIIDSYRWKRDGVQVTLNMEIEGYVSPTTDKHGTDIRGIKKLHSKVGMDPPKVRQAIEDGHANSQDYDDPPESVNPVHRKGIQNQYETDMVMAWKGAKGDYGHSIRERFAKLLEYFRLRFFSTAEEEYLPDDYTPGDEYLE